MNSDPSAPGEPPGGGGPARTPPDWSAAAKFLRLRLRRLLPDAPVMDLEDLTQEALIDLVRTSRQQPIHNQNALLNTLARRKAIDLMRRRLRWNALVRPLADGDDPGIAMRWRGTEPAERLAFVALRFFARERSECESLARAFMAGHDWAEVAGTMGLTATTVRKQWSRCVAHLRRTLTSGSATGGEALWTWLDRHEEQDDGQR